MKSEKLSIDSSLDYNDEEVEDIVNDECSSSSSFRSDQSYYDEIVDKYHLHQDEEDGSNAIEIRDKKKQNIDEES